MVAEINTAQLEAVANWISYWFQRFPWVGTLICFMVLDTITGLMAAFKTKTISSSIGMGGGFKKAGMIIALLFVALLNKTNPQIPGVEIVAAFFATNEGLSIVENLGRIGVPLPLALTDALEKVRELRQSKKQIPLVEHTEKTIVVVTKEEPNVGTDKRTERRQDDEATGADNGLGNV